MTKRVARRKGQGGDLRSQVQGKMRKLQRNVLDRVRKQSALLGREQKQVVERLVRQAERMQTGLEKDTRRLSRDVESRARRFLSNIEKRIEESLETLMNQLDLPSRHDIRDLARRLARLEQQLQRESHAQPAPVPAPTATPLPTPTPTPPEADEAGLCPETSSGE